MSPFCAKASQWQANGHYSSLPPATLSSQKLRQINTNRTAGKLQIVVKSHTILEESHDKNLTIPDRNTLGSPAVTIAELSTLGEYDRATLQVTAQKVKDPVTVSNGKQKQDIIVADSTGHTTLTLWEEDIGMIVENKSYQLNRVQIHHYLELNFPRFGASAEEIDDLLEVSMLHNNDDTTDLHSVTIIAVTKLETTLIAGNTCPATQTTPLLTANNVERNKNPATIKHRPNSVFRTVVASKILLRPTMKR